ncbi:MAG: hypothetical protein BGO29_11590 [Bacteroidales bacterium 36-12]|nr:MAG: hypothetical protein BGO29_11590 [Bacteroidales bacterium 36-12]
MLQQKEYTKIYTAYDKYGYLHLLLYNDTKTDALFFDGISFSYKPLLKMIPPEYSQLKYREKSLNTILEVESVKQSGDFRFIKFRNGDIFQIYFMMDDNRSNQILSIFQEKEHKHIATPLGINLYDSVLKAFDAAEECEIKNEK